MRLADLNRRSLPPLSDGINSFDSYSIDGVDSYPVVQKAKAAKAIHKEANIINRGEATEMLQKDDIVEPKAKKASLVSETSNCLAPDTFVSLPKCALFLLYIFIPKKARDHLLGDLLQEIDEINRRCGSGYARIFCWNQVIITIAPMVKARTAKLVNWLIKVGATGEIGHLLHRLLSK